MKKTESELIQENEELRAENKALKEQLELNKPTEYQKWWRKVGDDSFVFIQEMKKRLSLAAEESQVMAKIRIGEFYSKVLFFLHKVDAEKRFVDGKITKEDYLSQCEYLRKWTDKVRDKVIDGTFTGLPLPPDEEEQ